MQGKTPCDLPPKLHVYRPLCLLLPYALPLQAKCLEPASGWQPHLKDLTLLPLARHKLSRVLMSLTLSCGRWSDLAAVGQRTKTRKESLDFYSQESTGCI